MYNIASEESYEDGEIIFREASSGDWVYVILSGSVEISKTIRGENFIIAVLHPGEIFGELCFLGTSRRTATARAIGKTTVGVIDRAFLDKEFNKLSSDFRTILLTMVQRFEKMVDRASDFSYRKEERVAKSLSVAFRDRQTFVKAYTGNLSEGGLFVRTENPLPVGEQFLLKLSLPEIAEPLNIKCEVAWVRKKTGRIEGSPAGMGVKFCEMSQKANQTLKRYLKAIMKG